MSTYDFEMERGNNVPVRWSFTDTAGDAFPLDGADFVLAVSWRGGSIDLDSAEDAHLTVGAETSVVTWTPSVAESRSIPLGRLAQYELEYRGPDGKQRTWVRGWITGVGGLAGD